MTSLAALTRICTTKPRGRSSLPVSIPVPAQRGANNPTHLHLINSVLPDQPAAIPAHAREWQASASSSNLPLQRKLAIGAVNDPLEAEADAVANRVVGEPSRAASSISYSSSLRRAPAAVAPAVEAPAIVHDALRAAGQPLDAEARPMIEPQIGHDLAEVRIHTGRLADESARAVGAHAYTVGQHAVFAAGKFSPQTLEGRRLLAHELTHTVQQGRSVLASAAAVVQRQETTKTPTQQSAPTDVSKDKTKTDQAMVFFGWDDLLHAKLTPPSLLAPPQQGPLLPSPGTLTPGGTSAFSPTSPHSPPFGFSPPQIPSGGTGLQPPSLLTPPQGPIPPVTQPSPYFTPTPGSSSGSSSAAPAAPSRLSLRDFGRLSVGLRLGFPDMKEDDKPGAAPSALKESIKKAEILNFMFTGQPPSEYQVDAGKLIGAVWGIFSEKIAPDVARKIAAGMSSKGSGGGPTLQLDATLLISPSGGKGGGPGGGGGFTATLTF